eukprot:TRINITY_DN2122_c0_g1_i1.p1 TRINITY_DN2122_c0_g1~~TRINITY_DN2122_c0_g1_i1.p1  ORF type:complete len:312 (-),score=38.94 TRINITY_DN2122_c0_g1_i1:13-948(-)
MRETSDNQHHKNPNDSKTKKISKTHSGTLVDFDFNRLVLKEEIGKGSFGTVQRGFYDDLEVAVKFVNCKQNDFFQELGIMRQLPPHPNIVRLYAACTQPICLVLEYVNGGGLDEQLSSLSTDLPRILHAARDISLGMSHLHENDVIHRDLASRNVLIQNLPGNTTAIYKVCDFGLSRLDIFQRNLTQSNTCPIKWVAPENVPREDGEEPIYEKGSDVWMFANTVIEMFLGQPDPFPGQNEFVLAPKIRDEGLHPARPSSCPDEVWNILLACWQKSPIFRPSFSQITLMIGKICSKNNYITCLLYTSDAADE